MRVSQRGVRASPCRGMAAGANGHARHAVVEDDRLALARPEHGDRHHIVASIDNDGSDPVASRGSSHPQMRIKGLVFFGSGSRPGRRPRTQEAAASSVAPWPCA